MKRSATKRARAAPPGRIRRAGKKKSAKTTSKTTTFKVAGKLVARKAVKKTVARMARVAFMEVDEKMVAKTAGKRAMTTMPRAQIERMRERLLIALAAPVPEEDAAAARLIARARRELAAGREILIPLAVADRLAEGENPIKVIRQWRKLTQQQLAAAAGISQGYLSEIENGGRQGPLALHQTLARVLEVPLQTLTRD
jgi:DNA-binding XRE family transcriptional regulator